MTQPSSGENAHLARRAGDSRGPSRGDGRVRAALGEGCIKLPSGEAATSSRRAHAGPIPRDDARTPARREFWLTAVRDPSLRATLRGTLAQTYADVGELVDPKLAAADVRPGLDGRELAVLVDALTTGLLMHRALEPDGDQPLLPTKALHQLLADTPAPRTPSDSDEPP